MKLVALLCSVILLAAAGSSWADEDKVADALKFKMKSIEGKDVDLEKYKGKVVLIVNLASQ